MKFLGIIFFCLFFSCTDKERKEQSSAYFKNEISKRLEVIDKMELEDSLKTNYRAVDKEIDKLLLLSKDVENVNASINLSKEFFNELAVKNNIVRTDFVDIDETMTLEEIANALKGNELNFFNQVIFRYKGNDGALFTAQ